MAQITTYRCMECGMEFVEDGSLFFYDSNSKETIDYILLFSTVGLARGSKINGYVDETYCGGCNKFLRVYSINEVEGEIEDACKIVKEGIDNHFKKLDDEIRHLNDLKKDETCTLEKYETYYLVNFPKLEDYEYMEHTTRAKPENIIKRAIKDYHSEIKNRLKYKNEIYEKHLNSIYLVEYKSEEEYGALDKIKCPECGKEINRFINHETPCPKCGGMILISDCIFAD